MFAYERQYSNCNYQDICLCSFENSIKFYYVWYFNIKQRIQKAVLNFQRIQSPSFSRRKFLKTFLRSAKQLPIDDSIEKKLRVSLVSTRGGYNDNVKMNHCSVKKIVWLETPVRANKLFHTTSPGNHIFSLLHVTGVKKGMVSAAKKRLYSWINSFAADWPVVAANYYFIVLSTRSWQLAYYRVALAL